MRLHEFIQENREQILAEWETFARTCAPASVTMDVDALRDHAGEMLTVIAKDLMTSQGDFEQAQKSKGKGDDSGTPETTAAEEHGAGRAESGFTVEQMVAEYRALRASVLRLWTSAEGELGVDDIADMTRFNEAIDQSLAESVSEFNQNVDHAKEMFLAILGHDLRTPLGAIHTSARFMLETGELEEPHRTLTSRIAASSLRTLQMVGDLLDFTRSRLGGGIPVARAEMNLGKLVHEVVDEISAAHPEEVIEVDTREELLGEWDADRVSQALSNLLSNAVQHGSPGSPITVAMRGDEENVAITIHNRGTPIPPERLDGIFNPMKPSEAPVQAAARGPTGNLGLGLYIAERIVHAHNGWIDAQSSEEDGTTFTIHMPRRDSTRSPAREEEAAGG